MNIVTNQYLALPLDGYNHPLMVDVMTAHKHPAKTVESITGLLHATCIYSKRVLSDICTHGEEFGDGEHDDLETLLSEDRTDILLGGKFVLLGKELTKEDIHGIIGDPNETLIGPDSAVSLEGAPEVVFSFHATNNGGGPTYVMSRLQFRGLFPNEEIGTENHFMV
jgi:hypothetical protein